MIARVLRERRRSWQFPEVNRTRSNRYSKLRDDPSAMRPRPNGDETQLRAWVAAFTPLQMGMVRNWVTASGGWGQSREGDAPRSEAAALDARRLLPARPQPPNFVARQVTTLNDANFSD